MPRAKAEIPAADVAIKVPAELVCAAADLVPIVQALPAYKWIPVSKAAVLRLALSQGLEAMAAELVEPPTVTKPKPAKRATSTGSSAPRKRAPKASAPATGPAAELAAWRKGIGQTQKEAAAEFGTTQATWSRWEQGNGVPAGVDAEQLEALTAILAASWDTSE